MDQVLSVQHAMLAEVVRTAHCCSPIMGSQSFVPSQLSAVDVVPKMHGLVAQGLLVSLGALQAAIGLPNVGLQPPQL